MPQSTRVVGCRGVFEYRQRTRKVRPADYVG
jgi:hypothetical protein